jgi:hypothetical protein
MVKTMHDVVFTSIKANVQVANYFSMSADEVTTLDNNVYVYVYVMKD